MYRITLFIMLFLLSLSLFSQKGLKSKLYGKWQIESYEIFGEIHQPSLKERNDYILFKTNMFFEIFSEGNQDKGSWSFNKEAKISLITDDNQSLEVTLLKITSDFLTIKYNTKDLDYIIFHYKKQ
ncbi:lipocalin family protein [Tenacibaculum sp. 190524A02b]|uniref:lipocalin family protein n=1 Tax=Tenacibaculum vairaonense TaxID=3137860 RepID=UPI0031FA8CE4